MCSAGLAVVAPSCAMIYNQCTSVMFVPAMEEGRPLINKSFALHRDTTSWHHGVLLAAPCTIHHGITPPNCGAPYLQCDTMPYSNAVLTAAGIEVRCAVCMVVPGRSGEYLHY